MLFSTHRMQQFETLFGLTQGVSKQVSRDGGQKPSKKFVIN